MTSWISPTSIYPSIYILSRRSTCRLDVHSALQNSEQNHWTFVFTSMFGVHVCGCRYSGPLGVGRKSGKQKFETTSKEPLVNFEKKNNSGFPFSPTHNSFRLFNESSLRGTLCKHCQKWNDCNFLSLSSPAILCALSPPPPNYSPVCSGAASPFSSLCTRQSETNKQAAGGSCLLSIIQARQSTVGMLAKHKKIHLSLG